MILFETKPHRRYRQKCLIFLGSSFADLLALCMFPLYIINPTGIQFYIWKILWEELKRQLSYENIADYNEDDEHEHLSIIFGEGIVTIYKLPMTFITMVVCLMVPSVWSAGWHGFAHYRQMKNQAYAASSTIGKYYDIYDSEWDLTMNLLHHAVIDFWVGPFVLFAYMSPLRHASMTSLMERVNTEHYASHTLMPHNWDYKYNLWYRKKAVKYGALAVAGVRCVICIYIYFISCQLLYTYTDVYLHNNSTFDDGRFTCVIHYVAANMVDTIPLGTYQSHHTEREERIQRTFHYRNICSVVRYVRLYVCMCTNIF